MIPSTAFDATASGNSVDAELKYACLFRATFATCDGVVNEIRNSLTRSPDDNHTLFNNHKSIEYLYLN